MRRSYEFSPFCVPPLVAGLVSWGLLVYSWFLTRPIWSGLQTPVLAVLSAVGSSVVLTYAGMLLGMFAWFELDDRGCI